MQLQENLENFERQGKAIDMGDQEKLRLNKKWATELNRTFSKEEVQMAIKEMQIKTTLRFHLTSVCYHREHHQQKLERMKGKRNPHTLLVRM
jgi:hypothetical protein